MSYGGEEAQCQMFSCVWKYMHILSGREQRKKSDPKIYEGICLGYSTNNSVYRVFNKHTKSIMESINVTINDDQTKVITDKDETHGLTGQNFSCMSILSGYFVACVIAFILVLFQFIESL